MSEENVEVVRRAIEAFSACGVEGVAEFVHPDVVVEEPPTQPGARTARGTEDAARTLSAFNETWEEHRTETEEIRDLGGDDVLALTFEHLRGR